MTGERLVIIISADSDIETIEKAYKLGSEDYLKKPFHINQDVVYNYGYMSDLALRTLVKRLRLKVGKELIRNISELGYKIN